MINLILFLLASVLLLYTAVLYASTGLALLAFGGFFLMAFAYTCLLVLLITQKTTFSVPISITEQKNATGIELKIKNKLSVPITKLVFFLYYENTFTGERGRIRLKGAADGSVTTLIRTAIRTEHCGKYRITLQKIRFYDLTGIFYLSKYMKEQAELNVMPVLHETMVTISPASRHFIGESERYDNTAGGTDASEILQIRPFQNGDRIQNIHWKMSAKTDELLVRENRKSLGCPIVLLLDFPKNTKSIDAFLSLTASVSFAVSAQKCAHYAAWYSRQAGDIVRVCIEDEESFYLFLLTLYEENRLEKTKAATLEDYREKYRAEPFVTGITIHSDLKVTVGKDIKKVFTSINLKKELNGEEFIV